MAETHALQSTREPLHLDAHSFTSAWPLAHAAAVDALAGVGPNEPMAKHQLHRQRASEAAHNALKEAGLDPKRVRASITWGKDKPAVSLEVITMEGQRFEGGSQLDQRMTMPVAEVAKPEPPTIEPADLVDRGERAQQFFAGLLADEEQRDAQRQPPSALSGFTADLSDAVQPGATLERPVPVPPSRSVPAVTPATVAKPTK